MGIKALQNIVKEISITNKCRTCGKTILRRKGVVYCGDLCRSLYVYNRKIFNYEHIEKLKFIRDNPLIHKNKLYYENGIHHFIRKKVIDEKGFEYFDFDEREGVLGPIEHPYDYTNFTYGISERCIAIDKLGRMILSKEGRKAVKIMDIIQSE